MKVICISNKFKRKDSFDPKVGDVLTVIDAMMIDGDPSYLFEEIDSIIDYPLLNKEIEYWYNAKNFVPFDSYKEEEIKKELSEIFNN